MRTFLLALFLALSPAPLLRHCLAADDFPLAPAVECSPRGGLPNFLAKLKSGAEVRVAYLGGSITAQEGWRPKSLALLEKEFPKAKLHQINAAIGGTRSDLGVFRLRHDVLEHKPDLLFVEFAVNDAGAPPEHIIRCMEGIVRQTWRALPDCDICFVYTLTENVVPTWEEGKLPRSASAMEKVAEHYAIPSIGFGVEVARLAKEGKIILKGPLPKNEEEKKELGEKLVFSPDGVHPYPATGHELYLGSIRRSLPAIWSASAAGPAPHELKAPLVADNFEDAKMVPITSVKHTPGIKKLDPESDAPHAGLAKRFGNRLPGPLYRGDKPGEAVAFRFKGRYAALYDVIGPDCGQVLVTVDDGKPALHPRFDAYCTDYRLNTMILASGLADGVHTVRIEIDKDQPDKAKILAQRHEKIDNPKRFDDTAFYPGAILIVGELVED
jgi:lysophospholipase L1-like esterase